MSINKARAGNEVRMKDRLITILEAVRLSQATLAKYIESGGRKPVTAINELLTILDDENVEQAMAALYPNIDSPGVSPADGPDLKEPIRVNSRSRI
jgi:hypothetical protein